jgi:outer membrane cobalamin receptor
MPDFDLTTTLETRIIERLTGFADLGLTGKREGMAIFPLISSANAIQRFAIDPSIRLNLGATYEMTSKFKLFGRVDNLLNRKNEQWFGYASQGLRLLAGVTLSF